jgi:hypothetical protein
MSNPLYVVKEKQNTVEKAEHWADYFLKKWGLEGVWNLLCEFMRNFQTYAGMIQLQDILKKVEGYLEVLVKVWNDLQSFRKETTV